MTAFKAFFATIFVLVFTLSAAQAAMVSASAKKTACTITINSKDEKEAFRKKLPPGQWEFVELLPKEKKGTDDGDDDDENIPKWLNEACEKGVQCDLLLVSGHFGGSFFGSSGYELSLEQLERASCRQACAGIIKKPREVFLMGCNTLAGKEKDKRTPEEYLRVLLADGMDRSRAEQTVALRYSPWGDANFQRMRAVFSEASKIYGFSSVGPLGKTSGPRLQSYFSKTGANYSQYLSKLTKQSPPNQPMKSAFVSTSFIEGIGEKSHSSSAICYLEDKKVVHLNKVRFVEQALGSTNPMEHAPAIASWLKTIQANDWSDQEGEMWDRLTWNRALKEHFISTASNIHHLPSIEVNLWRFAMHMRWITPSQYRERQEAAVAPFFEDKKITREERDAVCGLVDQNEKIIVDYRRLGISDISPDMATALACLGNANADIVAAAEKAILSPVKKMRENGLIALYLAFERAKFRQFNIEFLKSAQRLEKEESLAPFYSMLIAAAAGRDEKFWLDAVTELVSLKVSKLDNATTYLWAGAKDIHPVVLPILMKRIFSIKTIEDFSAKDGLYAHFASIAVIVWKLPGISARDIAENLLAYESSPFIELILSFLVSGDDIPKEKKIQALEIVSSETTLETVRTLASNGMAQVRKKK